MPTTPILITSSVVPHDQTVNLKDPGSRVFHTIEGLDQWLKILPNGSFVLCDGSGYDFKNIVSARFPKANIECLSFLNNGEFVKFHGKGYGEGEIIKYALRHSKLLNDAGSFIKCTAKLWVDNFRDCIKNTQSNFLCQAYFSDVFSLKKTTLKYIDTRFYFFKKDYYCKYFLDAHQGLSISSGYGIEESFRDIVVKNGLTRFLIKNPVKILGVGGGSGSYYRNSTHRYLKDKLRLQLIQLNSNYKELFI